MTSKSLEKFIMFSLYKIMYDSLWRLSAPIHEPTTPKNYQSKRLTTEHREPEDVTILSIASWSCHFYIPTITCWNCLFYITLIACWNCLFYTTLGTCWNCIFHIITIINCYNRLFYIRHFILSPLVYMYFNAQRFDLSRRNFKPPNNQ